MFSIQQKQEIAEAVQQILRRTNHPELPKEGEINFKLDVMGAEPWSYVVIRNNGVSSECEPNYQNELMDPRSGADKGRIAPEAGPNVLREDDPDYHEVMQKVCEEMKNRPSK